MDDKTLDLHSRRRFLALSALALGALGAGAFAYPFIRAMSPAKDVLASGILEVDISDLGPGALKTIIWRRQPVFILKRTARMIEADSKIDPKTLSDPAGPEERTKTQDLFVSIGICTHLGCVPQFMERLPGSDESGFYCPCHAGRYDTLGRRLSGPPPENLHLVPFRATGKDSLIIGTEKFAGYAQNARKVDELPGI